MSIEQVANSASGHTEERTSRESVEEPAHEHGLNVLCHRAWDKPDEEQREGDDVDVSSAVELDKVSSLSLSRNVLILTSESGLRNSGPMPTVSQ